jgi:hypothetical protein
MSNPFILKRKTFVPSIEELETDAMNHIREYTIVLNDRGGEIEMRGGGGSGSEALPILSNAKILDFITELYDPLDNHLFYYLS